MAWKIKVGLGNLKQLDILELVFWNLSIVNQFLKWVICEHAGYVAIGILLDL